jgi:alpha-amylase
MGNMKKLSAVLVLLLAVSFGCDSTDTSTMPYDSEGSVSAAAYGGSTTTSDVILQGFIWGTQSGWWTTINTCASTISSAGFTYVWLPPCSAAADTHGYLPTQWYSLTSSYGTQAQLTTAITTLHSKSIKVLADIVINHRCGSTGWADFTNPAFTVNNSAICKGDEYFSSGNPGYGSTVYGAADTGEGYSAGRDLDHSYSSVQTQVKSWQTWLKSTIGFDGWRYDFVKGYSGSYIGTYNTASTPSFSVGEYWPTSSFSSSSPNVWRQELINWVDATGGKSAVFDFVTKPLLATAISNGNYALLKDSNSACAGTIGWWPQMSVTFLDNHDTGASPYGQSLWTFPSGSEAMGYAYILTHPGTPCVFWPHYFDYGTTLQSQIKSMIAIRKAQGITSTSAVSIQVADSTRYAAIINSNTAMKIGPGSWSPTGTWTLKLSGTNFAIWTK